MVQWPLCNICGREVMVFKFEAGAPKFNPIPQQVQDLSFFKFSHYHVYFDLKLPQRALIIYEQNNFSFMTLSFAIP